MKRDENYDIDYVKEIGFGRNKVVDESSDDADIIDEPKFKK